MALFDSLNAKNFELFAGRYYTNPQCTSYEEFQEDLLRFKYLKKLFTRYSTKRDLQLRLILNHIIVLYNVFEADACTAMMFHKIPGEHWSTLKTILIYLNYMPEESENLPIDIELQKELEKI